MAHGNKIMRLLHATESDLLPGILICHPDKESPFFFFFFSVPNNGQYLLSFFLGVASTVLSTMLAFPSLAKSSQSPLSQVLYFLMLKIRKHSCLGVKQLAQGHGAQGGGSSLIVCLSSLNPQHSAQL